MKSLDFIVDLTSALASSLSSQSSLCRQGLALLLYKQCLILCFVHLCEMIVVPCLLYLLLGTSSLQLMSSHTDRLTD